MPSNCYWIRCSKCCDTSALCGKKQKPHLYCGCRERRKQRKMTCATAGVDNDRQTLVDTESAAADVLEYDFGFAAKAEEWELDGPTTPFVHQLNYVLQPGSNVILQATILPNALSFAINLCMKEKDVIAFHFNPRLDQGYSARNSKLEGKWGNEEGISHQGFPFARNQSFNLEIFLTHSDFLVAVNGIHYCAFAYRTSLLNIDLIEIVGDVKIKRVVLKTTDSYPSPLIGSEETPNRICNIITEPQVHRVTKCENKNTPFIGLLKESIRSGTEIEISGTVKLLPYVFSINFQQGSSMYPHPVINLHVSVRFNQLAYAGNHVVLCNAWNHDQGWGNEEFSPRECPFIPGSDFIFRILCRDDAFVAWVNEQPLFAFKHRYDFKKIDTIYVQGEVFMKEIKVFW